ncbi:MAG: hypothetical protein P4L84_29390 [Isosphaeraceae bacterium]|nr:hypothetical protein [Isosphaeraceae bacterium]
MTEEHPSAGGPDYYLASFPRDGFPRYVWTNRPASLPEEVWISETTHRDGQQGGLPLTTELSCRIYDILCGFTGGSGAIRQAEFFPYRPSDRAALEWAIERHRDGAPIEPTTWIRACRDDVALIRRIGIRETGMLCSASDYHTFHKFKPGGRRQAAELYLNAVEMTLEAGIRPRVHLEDATRAPIDFVRWLVEAVLDRADHYGADLRPRFRVCDTLGVGLPYDDVDLPRSVPLLIRAMREMGIAPPELEFHPHNDTWLVVANCLAAIREGCGVISGTSLGKGERTGNAPVEAVLLHLVGMGYWSEGALDFRVLNDLAELYARMGETLPPKYPLFGRDAYVTRAGIHADGINKFWWMYAPFNAPLLVGRDLEVSLTKDSGAAGVLFVIKQHLGIELLKDDPRVEKVREWLDDQFENGRVTSVDWGELEPIVRPYFH